MSDGPETHRPKPATARAAAAYARPGARKTTGIRGLASILRRRVPSFLVTFAIVVGAGLAFLAVQVPLYRASSEVVSSGTADDGPEAAARLIRTPALAQDVARALRLDRDASFIRSGSGNTLIAQVRELAGIDRPAPVPAGSAAAMARASYRLRASISVTRPADTVSLLIGYTARSPQLAARVANEYARQYAKRRLVEAGAQGGGVRILAEAEPPLSPITPSPIPVLIAAVALGLAAGVLVAVVRERRFRGITSGGEIEARTGLHHLGTVPLVGTVLKGAASPADAIVASPRSGFAEAFRSLRTSIRIAGGEDAQVVAITSPSVGEGKTVVATCLARTIALSGDSVLLIDCTPGAIGAGDLLGHAAPSGLADVIAGTVPLDTVLLQDAASGAYVVPLAAAGTDMPDGAQLRSLMDDLRQRFSHIVLVAPSVLGSNGAATPSLPADLFVIAAKWRSTPDRAVRQVATTLLAAGGRVGGVALTQVDMHKQVKYVHDDESNYYAKLSKYYS